jgi:hypothetical protein
MRRLATGAVAAAMVALGCSATAFGHTGSATDPSGDVAGNPSGNPANFDIVASTFGDGPHGKLVHTVRVAGAFGNPQGSGLVPLLYINVPSYPGATRECDYFVGRVKSRVGVFLCGTRKRLGGATIVRRGGNALRYTFNSKAIGRPAAYEWAFVFQGPGSGTTVDYDRIPDGQTSMYTYQVR